MRWSLNELYTSFDSNEFKRDYKKFNEEIEIIKSWCSENLKDISSPVEKTESFIKKQTEFLILSSRLLSYASLTLSVDAKNEVALQVMDKLESKLTEITGPQVLFDKWVGSLDNLEEIISKSSLLEEHRFYLTQIAERNKYLLSEKEEVIISKMKNTGSNAWNKLQELLTSTLLVDINVSGEHKQLPLPVVRNMAFDKDSNTRRNAHEAELKSYEKIEEPSAACLNGIKGEVITVSKLRGYESPLQKNNY